MAVVRAGGTPADALENRLMVAGRATVERHGRVRHAGVSAPADYERAARGPRPDEVPVLARPLWVQSAGGEAVLRTDSTAYGSAEPIIVTWKNAPANRWDWIGVYKKGAADPDVDYYLIWQYTGGAGSGTSAGTVSGTLTMDRQTVEGEPWPLPTGDYVMYYLLADGYEWVAKTEFRVK